MGMLFRECRCKNAGAAGYAEAFTPVLSGKQTRKTFASSHFSKKNERIANVFVDFERAKHGKIDVRLICRATQHLMSGSKVFGQGVMIFHARIKIMIF